MKKGIRLLLIYLTLLTASFAFESLFYQTSPSKPTGHRLQPSSSADETHTPVLIIHGFLGITSEIDALAQALHRKGRSVFIPDLYQFSHQNSDYSLVGRLPELNRYLDDQGFISGHVIAMGLGGPAAIQFARHFPERVDSLTLLSASATQKYELLGDYSLNKALYSLQSVFYWALNHLIPDFGVMQQLPFQQEHLRSLADIDLRPVEAQLTQLQLPVLVVHGRDDYLVPVQAAKQHHALLAQGELALFNMSHVMNTSTSSDIQAKIASFFSKVETDQFTSQTTAYPTPEESTISGPRFWLITGLVFIGTKFSEDLATVAAGLLVSRDILPFWVAVLVCFFGIMAGDTAIYFFGRIAGIRILRKRPLRWIISEQQVLDSEEWFRKRGLTVIVLSRFVPATRFPVYMATGILGVPPLKFIGVLSLAALVWTPLIIGLAAILGAPLLDLMEKYEKWSLPILLIFFITLTLLIKILLPLATRRGRKLFYVRWQRLWRPTRKRKAC